MSTSIKTVLEILGGREVGPDAPNLVLQLEIDRRVESFRCPVVEDSNGAVERARLASDDFRRRGLLWSQGVECF